MAKRHKKPGQTCPFCGETTTAVFEEPTSRKLAGFWYEKHKRRADAMFGPGKPCARSGQGLGMASWPAWALTLNEASIKKLRGG
jgi:hypothetical protein